MCGYEENELESVELFDLDEKMEFTAGKLQFEDVIKVRFFLLKASGNQVLTDKLTV